jgi:hypothetical protein
MDFQRRQIENDALFLVVEAVQRIELDAKSAADWAALLPSTSRFSPTYASASAR